MEYICKICGKVIQSVNSRCFKTHIEKEHNIKLVRILYTNLDIKLKDLEVD